MVRALRNVPQGSLVDELLQLHDLGREAVPSRPVHGVCIIPFTENEDLFQLLGASSPPLVETASVESDFYQQQQGLSYDQQAEDLTEHGVDLVELGEPEGTGGDIDELGHGFGDEASSIIIAPDLPQAQPPSEEEKRAALAILDIYRRGRLRRGRGRARPTSSIAKIFFTCLKLSHEMSWDKNPSYRFIFLGPLPHILVCLDVALASTSSHKRTTKRRLLEDRHENLDGVTNRMNELVYVILVKD